MVLNTFSRRVVGWAIDSRAGAYLVITALSMAMDTQDPGPEQSCMRITTLNSTRGHSLGTRSKQDSFRFWTLFVIPTTTLSSIPSRDACKSTCCTDSG